MSKVLIDSTKPLWRYAVGPACMTLPAMVFYKKSNALRFLVRLQARFHNVELVLHMRTSNDRLDTYTQTTYYQANEDNREEEMQHLASVFDSIVMRRSVRLSVLCMCLITTASLLVLRSLPPEAYIKIFLTGTIFFVHLLFAVRSTLIWAQLSSILTKILSNEN